MPTLTRHLFSEGDDVVVFGRGADGVRFGRQQTAEQARRDFEQAHGLVVSLGEARVSSAGDIAWATMDRAVVEANVSGERSR